MMDLMVNFVQRFRNLPKQTKQLLSLAVIIALVVALPLFVWAVLTQRLDLRKRAETGEPPVQTPINWVTKDIAITADDLYILANGKTYVGSGSFIEYTQKVISNSQVNMYVTSNQYGEDFRLQINFLKNNTIWYISQIKVYNLGLELSTTYSGQFFPTALGYSNSFGNGCYFVYDPQTKIAASNVEICYKNLKIQAFTGITPLPTADIDGDANNDGYVNGEDLAIIILNYRKTPILDIRADLNQDGFVNGKDLAEVIWNYALY